MQKNFTLAEPIEIVKQSMKELAEKEGDHIEVDRDVFRVAESIKGQFISRNRYETVLSFQIDQENELQNAIIPYVNKLASYIDQTRPRRTLDELNEKEMLKQLNTKINIILGIVVFFFILWLVVLTSN
ncbi:MAG: hypothetical protein H0Z33_00955 [Bacillaceae bacterium]|nr:hypothetical protein [Bacillaceae bacterium]